MTITWQDLIAALMVLLAAGYVVWYAAGRAKRNGSSGCGCCPNCPTDEPEQPLVNIDDRPRD
jgi:hypothetical protein